MLVAMLQLHQLVHALTAAHIHLAEQTQHCSGTNFELSCMHKRVLLLAEQHGCCYQHCNLFPLSCHISCLIEHSRLQKLVDKLGLIVGLHFRYAQNMLQT